jgi:RsiW-degrading membrane proteinase PrsW (M82 family)
VPELNFAALFALALAPALFWLWFFMRRDRQPEPAWLLARTFAWGALMVIPAGLLEAGVASAFGTVVMFALVGIIEEGAKLIAASSVLNNKEFDEPVDGLIYATAAALGFATLENALYMLEGGAALILVRGPISTLGHILFAGAWGYALSLRRFAGRRFVVRRALLLAAALHTAFNFLLLGASSNESLAWLLLPFAGLMILMWRLTGAYYRSSARMTAPDASDTATRQRADGERASNQV